MTSSRLPLPPSFPFPFPAYSIQESFMTSLFRCLDEEKLGIFESPTGTGKSLSMICGALTWFHAYEEHRKTDIKARINKLGECVTMAFLLFLHACACA
jgi:chromosome transmission fidelity protein 1